VGFGTLTRTDPVFQGLQRTRLADPLLSFLGTNDQAAIIDLPAAQLAM